MHTVELASWTGSRQRLLFWGLCVPSCQSLGVYSSSYIRKPHSVDFRQLREGVQVKQRVFPAAVFLLWARKYRELMSGRKLQGFYISSPPQLKLSERSIG